MSAGARARLAAGASAGLGTLWALSMGVVGLWVLGGAGAPQRAGLGVALVSGAQLVFLILVADRVFPGAPRLFTRTVLGVLGVVCLFACVSAVSSLLLRGGAA